MNGPVITARNIHKTFSTLKAVNDVGFSVQPGTCFGFLGPNGAGKSTLMKMIYGRAHRDMPEKSVLDVLGFDPQTNDLAIKYVAGVVPQENNLDQDLGVTQNLQIFCRFYDMSPAAAGKRIDELLGFLELSEKKHAPIRSLSGGMMRRLIIARALLNTPKLLILDEPTTGLDPQVRHLIWDKIRNLKKQGMTVLLTTHYMDEAYQMCDTIFIMDKGKKVMEGAPQKLIEENIEGYVLEILNTEQVGPLFDTIQSSTIRKDVSTDTGRLYSNDAAELEKILSRLNPGEYYFRQSNLEDLFLKTTGRSLNDDQ